ncbi:alpha-amylase family protein [Candidatus Chlorohelix allophototropha]|uniref:Alpha-amylase family protein n=2 Tax=Candidatus Chlorohelix allophototropha TaxID=3003348 RepID=A0ABY9B624_9CHLR|nr:alpha-amylase family protein [Chloroflexota bacterium L227-S17]
MSNAAYMRPNTRKAYTSFVDKLNKKLQKIAQAWNPRDRDLFLIRLERYFADFYEPLASLYQSRPDFEEQFMALASLIIAAYAERPEPLKKLDVEREITPDWFQRESMVGGIYYVDLFAGTLKGVREKMPYLQELGANYIHLMPLLKPREGANDGGYAVEDYCAVNPELGNMDDLENLATELHSNNMSLCIDLVVNHTAKEHEWARRAMEGDPKYLDYYFTYDESTLPDAYEKTLPEVFPDFAPGNFTWYPNMAGKGKWVWTTFNEFQWDLNYTNLAVFCEMLSYMFFLANKGVDILRLDAVPFMWKRMGTNCQNQPEVHELLQAFHSLMRIVAPSVIFKAEAIVAPQDLIHYLGTGRHTGKECELAYNNSLMVLLWSTLASRKVTIMTHTLLNMPATPVGTTWVTYVRLHDDIGWAITDENAQAVGENGFLHRNFLNEFYSGKFPGSFSRGELFQYNPANGDGRMSGMTASLAGLEKAVEKGNPRDIDLAIRRILLLYSIIFTYGGIPLIYMGDELGLCNDKSYLKNPLKANDNRWMHRPAMPWKVAARRHDAETVTGRIFKEMKRMITIRQQTRQLHGASTAYPLWTDNEHVFAYVRQHPAHGNMVALCNFSEFPVTVGANILMEQKLSWPIRDISQPDNPPLRIEWGRLALQPYQFLWLISEDELNQG